MKMLAFDLRKHSDWHAKQISVSFFNRPMKRFLLTAAVIAAITTPAHSQTITSGFDLGLESWSGAGGTVSWVSSGGSPGGYLRQADNAGTWMTVSAPSAFHGNLSAFLGGSLSFDARNFGGAADLTTAPLFGTVTITGSGGSASRSLAGLGQPPADQLWHNYSASLTSALWSGNLAGALTNVTQISVVLEFNDAIVETAGFDNFTLQGVSTVPEPSSFAMVGLGIAVVAAQLRRKAKR